MKNRIIKFIAIINVLILCLTFSSNISLAVVSDFKSPEYTERYQRWLNLSEEERQNTIEPTNKYDLKIEDKYEDIFSINNVFKTFKLLKASYISKYDLRDVIGENLKVKNQGETSLCWAFSAIANLETNLAIQDKKNDKTITEYDFSEQHMAYGTTRQAFLEYAINERGFNKNVTDSGNYHIATAYLTNGLGAIGEKDMPFDEESIGKNIDINELKNKKIKTTVIDTKLFTPPASQKEKEELMEEMKQYIVTKGGISAQIYGASLSDVTCYNNETGALYADDENEYPVNHGVIIIGWDDNFSRYNFNENKRPSKDGAWIIKNSWGEEIRENLIALRESIRKEYDKAPALFEEYYNITSRNQITSQWVLNYYKLMFGETKTRTEGEDLVVEIGDKGCMYVSYEDINILSGLFTIENAKNTKDYDNIYQYDYLGTNYAGIVPIGSSNGKFYMANVFETKNKGKEEITKIAINTLIPLYNCKVLINPNGSAKKYSDLQRVELKEGEYEDIGTGYHTIEFANPVKINGSTFVVVIEMDLNNLGDPSGATYFPLLENMSNTFYTGIETKTGRSFYTDFNSMQDGTWVDLGSYLYVLPLKAFTNNIGDAVVTLTSLEIEKGPNKTVYEAGEDFDETGMVVYANYSDGSKIKTTDYIVTNGTNLKENQESVTITYTEKGVTKSATQAITVNKAKVVLKELEIKTIPDKTLYEEGENFDPTGMKINAVYSDESRKELKETEYIIMNGENLKVTQKVVSIKYTEDGITKYAYQSITVNEKQEEKVLTGIEVTKAPNKTVYEVGENFDSKGMVVKANYLDGSNKEVTNYTITNGTNLQEGQTEVTITYTEGDITKAVKQSITVNKQKVVLTGLEITKAPNKTVYEVGENFDKTGMAVNAIYSDGTKKEVTNYTISGGTNLKLNQTYVTITYTEGDITKTAYQSITVNKQQIIEEKKLVKIEIGKVPNKTVYEVGENFDKTGMIVNAIYSDGSKEEITNYTVVNGTNLKESQESVTITYTEDGITKTVTQNIKVNKPKVVLTGIEVTKAPNKTVYEEGEKFDKTGMIVYANYSDGSKEEVTNYTITDGENLKVSQTYVTITYTEDGITKYAYQNITVNKKQEVKVLTKIEIKTIPDKTVYEEGDNFDKTGMVINAIYSDGSKKEVTNYTISGGTNLKEGQTEVIVTYTEGEITKTIKQDIVVKAKEKEHPTPSDFIDAEANITSAKSYIYVNKNKDDYVLMNVELKNIKLGDEKSSRKFYYFISDGKGEKQKDIDTVKGWAEFNLKDSTSANISIDTRNIKYISNMTENSNLYIYIKEVTNLGEESITTMNMVELKNKASIEVYVDDVKKDDTKPSTPGKDNTTATETIPQTGNKISGIVIAIIAFIGIAGFSYYKYKNLKDLNL